MSIRFIVGLPGHGKTLFMMHRICDTLLNTKRVVVTTLQEIDVPKLHAYLATKAPNRDLQLHRRLFFVAKGDTAEFCRHRGHETLAPLPLYDKRVDTKTIDTELTAYYGPAIEYTHTHPGVDFFITEAHRHLKADRWDSMADALSFYFTQHRHFDDNIWIETQLPKQVAVQIRDLCDECVELRNHYRERFGWFPKKGCFRAIWYYSVPKTGTRPEPFLRESFTLDVKGIAGCYSTRGAITGTGTPETPPDKKGLPFWTLFAAGAAVICLVPLLIIGGFKLINYGIGAAFKSGEKTLTTKVMDGREPPKKPPTVVTAPESPAPDGDGRQALRIVTINYITRRGHQVNFFLSDGTVLTTYDKAMKDANWDQAARRLTLKDGRVYYLKGPPLRRT